MNDVKERIIESAKVQFLQYGYKKTNLDDIVRKVKISKGTIYNYYKNKDDLFRQVCLSVLTEMLENIKGIVDSEPDVKKKFIVYTSKKVEFMQGIIMQHRSNSQVVQELTQIYDFLQIGNPWEPDIIAGILKTGIEKKVFKKCNIKKTSMTISMIFRKFDIDWFLAGIENSKDDIEAIFDLIFNGLLLKK